MRIRIEVYDCVTDETLETLGECLTDSPNRAVQMYEDNATEWAEKGYSAAVRWVDITNKAAQALGKIKSTRKAKTSAANGKLGGRGHKRTK